VLDLLPGRAIRLAAQAAVLTAVVGGTVVYAHGGKSVTLVVDGTATTVQDGAADVRDLLRDEGIRVTGKDLVAPGLDQPLRAGQQVVVRFARPLRVTVDGVPRTYWTTKLTVEAALAALGIRQDGARLSASRSQPLGRGGLDVTVSTPKRVTVVADGWTRDVTSTAVTVSDLLAETGLTPRPADRLSVLPGAPVVAGLVVALTRIDTTQVTVTESVPAAVVRRPSADLDVGDRVVVVPGHPGSRTAVYRLLLTDGHEAGRTLLSALPGEPPVASVVEVGTRKRARRTARSVAGADGLNWAALARCESGGNPRAVNPAGYYGLYQFSAGSWRAVGGSGLPSAASPSEQLYRAQLLFERSGAGQWSCGPHLYD
jgi:uncharacterized protein YabE (DUF348 family)